jgi:hypothetical protein
VEEMRSCTCHQLEEAALGRPAGRADRCAAHGGPAAASPEPGAHNPDGDNGTVKVDDSPFDSHPDNEPHVGCTFEIDFSGFDAGALDATVTFEAQPPTTRSGDDQVLLTDSVFIGEDDSSGGGSEEGLDASESYTLDFAGITPHPERGFHVKLTVHAEGARGADTKYKVFWVTGCESEGSPPPPPPTSSPKPTHPSPGSHPSPTPNSTTHSKPSANPAADSHPATSPSTPTAVIEATTANAPRADSTGGGGLPLTGWPRHGRPLRPGCSCSAGSWPSGSRESGGRSTRCAGGDTRRGAVPSGAARADLTRSPTTLGGDASEGRCVVTEQRPGQVSLGKDRVGHARS